MHWHWLGLASFLFDLSWWMLNWWRRGWQVQQVRVYVLSWRLGICGKGILIYLTCCFTRLLFLDLRCYKLNLLGWLSRLFCEILRIFLCLKLFDNRLLILFGVIRGFYWVLESVLRTYNIWRVENLWFILELDSPSHVRITYYCCTTCYLSNLTALINNRCLFMETL